MANDPDSKRLLKVLELLEKEYGGIGTGLKFGSVFRLAVAVILSAQCTDERVNKVTKELFKKCRTPKDFAEIPQKELEKLVFSTGFYRAKARNIKAMTKKVLEEHNGKLPDSIEELIKLPGMGRKTANVILGEGFGKIEGIVVDTHVKRLSNRLGFTKNQNPEKIETDLMGLVPRAQWREISNVLIWHGRKVCFARKPNCAGCAVNKLCPSAFRGG